VPFTIARGQCFLCTRGFFSACERSTPNAKIAADLWGHSPAGLFGYLHLLGGFPDCQAEYLRDAISRPLDRHDAQSSREIFCWPWTNCRSAAEIIGTAAVLAC
jgi:threonine dehydrogenase-like Zn-dependent dehydrogenase